MQATIMRQTIASEAAPAIIAGAGAKAREMGVPMAIAVCDESGTLKGITRLDGAALLAAPIAQDTAYTALSFGMATHERFNFIETDAPLLHGIVRTPRLIVFDDGYPINTGDAVIGGIGVSGGHYTHAMDVAQVGLSALEGAV